MILPIRKSPCIITSTMSESHDNNVRGQLLRQASTCVRMVVKSSKVNFVLATTRFRCNFMLLTAASQRPPKSGAHSGMNLHSIFCAEQNSKNGSLYLSLLQEFLDISGGTTKVCAMVTPDCGQTATANDETPECNNEGWIEKQIHKHTP